MKMELSIAAPVDGTVAEIVVGVGDRVTQDQHLARVESSADEVRRGDERSEADE
jgi:pyruvate/2-oxoglutarate dehydrogenase complex dihydrolipoamide acyltransferase (E2) component